MDITVYRTTGSLLRQLKSNGLASISLAQGIYIVKVTDGTKMMLKKIVV